MGGLLTKIFGGPATELVKGVGGIIDNLNTSDKEKLDAKIAMMEIERKFNADLLTADSSTVKEQAEVIKAEVESASWLARNWRPILMLVLTYILAHTYVLAPLFSLPPVIIPEPMWELLKLGIGGYVVGRTVEKTATTLVPIIQSKIDTK
jgi:hypothetical protein